VNCVQSATSNQDNPTESLKKTLGESYIAGYNP